MRVHEIWCNIIWMMRADETILWVTWSQNWGIAKPHHMNDDFEQETTKIYPI